MAVLLFRVVIIYTEHMRRFEEITVFLIFFQYLSAFFIEGEILLNTNHW